MFLAEAEHMLKTPLTVILSCAEVLGHDADELTDADRCAVVAALARNAALLAEQVDRLLEEAMAEVGSGHPHTVDLDLAEAVATTLGSFNGTAHGHRLHLREGSQSWAQADPRLLAQVLGHLLDNAVKYSPPGAPIDLSVRQIGPWAQIEVRDQGVGLPAGIDVFAAFQRGPSRAAQDRAGVGLGLHIVAKLTRAMGGEATAHPNTDTGTGTTFTVRLPGVRPHPGGPSPAAVPLPRQPLSGRAGAANGVRRDR